MQYGVLVISTILTGSEYTSVIPGIGTGFGCLTQLQIGTPLRHFCISFAGSRPAPNLKSPIDIGKIHFQQISVIGFVNYLYKLRKYHL
jgi:hypothetical protein